MFLSCLIRSTHICWSKCRRTLPRAARNAKNAGPSSGREAIESQDLGVARGAGLKTTEGLLMFVAFVTVLFEKTDQQLKAFKQFWNLGCGSGAKSLFDDQNSFGIPSWLFCSDGRLLVVH